MQYSILIAIAFLISEHTYDIALTALELICLNSQISSNNLKVLTLKNCQATLHLPEVVHIS